VTVYLRNAGDFAAMNEAYAPYFPKDPPTRTTVVAGFAPDEALIQISVVAIAAGAERVVVHPPEWLRSPNPYSYGVKSGDTLFLSGLVSRNVRENTIVGGDMATQTRVVLESAGAILKAAGMSHADVVSARVFITDTAQFQQMNAAYREFFPQAPPARATVKASLMNPQYLIEITFVAAKGRRAVDAGGRPNPNLSPATQAGNTLYVSGMLGVTDATRTDVQAQTRATLERIDTALKAGGFEASHVSDCVIYVTSLANRDAVQQIVARHFPSAPATVTVESGLVSPDGLVEIMCTAVK
jgi:aminoacrylate peracid reductase